MKTIVALVDFSDLAFKVLKQAHSLAKALRSHVILLHVVPPEPVVVGFGPVAASITRDATAIEVVKDQAQLEELADSLKNSGIEVSTKQIHATTVETLLEECERLSADVIIVGSHSHGSLYNLLIGSVTQSVLRKAPCPVLVVPNI